MSDTRDDILPLAPHLRGYARALTAGNVEFADDLVQDTVMLALQAWKRFTPGTSLKAWLFQILHNRFCSAASRKHVRAESARMISHSWPRFQPSRKADRR